MEKINRRGFIGGASAFTLFAKRLKAQESERSPEALLNDLETLATDLSGLEEEMRALGVAYGDHFKNETLDQLDEEAVQRFGSFLERV